MPPLLAQVAALAPMVRALAPNLGWVDVVAAAVGSAPGLTRWARSAPESTAPAAASRDDVQRLMREMSAPPRN